ncbi:MAG: acetyl-CoA acetyltransferase, partial [Proteobacteria bacterium]|nr:acetyl-CoA acetyltransferase [Pseudomonadota bacterium]
VYFLAGGRAVDRQRFLVERSNFTRSAALAAAAGKALRRAGLSIEEVECFDLYSCFPCAVAIARRMLGVPDDDPRPLTLTGGLGFFGGPGNNYSLHAIATLCEAIAVGERENGMVTALGWFLHKHAAGLYGAEPRSTDLGAQDAEDAEAFLAGDAPVAAAGEPSGVGTIETYTVVGNRDGAPEYAVVYGRTGSGARFVAQTVPDPAVFAELTEHSQVGRRVRLRYERGTGRSRAELA